MSNRAKTFNSTDDKKNVLGQLVCYRLDDLFEKLEVNLRHSGKAYTGCCPIHGGDNYSAISLYPEGYSLPGYWKCRTHFCEQVFQPTIIGFTRGVLSHKYYNWTLDSKKSEDMAPFNKVIEWLCKFLGQSWDSIKVDPKAVEIHKFATQVQSFKRMIEKETQITKELIRQHLEIPAKYYLEWEPRRQPPYKPETLDHFDVGLCNKPGKEMYNRVVVPFYDDSGTRMLGCTARSLHEKCEACKLYHNPASQCPSKAEKGLYPKWRHSGNPGSTLYNWWHAKHKVRETGKLILVEGPGDVWRLWEAGIENAVAMFGAGLTDEQQIVIERSGAMNISIVRDNDATGEMSEAKLKDELSFYKLRFIVPPAGYKDVGAMPTELVQKEIIPCLG
jgi:hypothetical protein